VGSKDDTGYWGFGYAMNDLADYVNGTMNDIMDTSVRDSGDRVLGYAFGNLADSMEDAAREATNLRDGPDRTISVPRDGFELGSTGEWSARNKERRGDDGEGEEFGSKGEFHYKRV
jgi:hypothetical protein